MKPSLQPLSTDVLSRITGKPSFTHKGRFADDTPGTSSVDLHDGQSLDPVCHAVSVSTVIVVQSGVVLAKIFN